MSEPISKFIKYLASTDNSSVPKIYSFRRILSDSYRPIDSPIIIPPLPLNEKEEISNER